MYDPTTERLISSIPNLENVDSSELPKLLSKLYSEIISYSEDILSGNHARVSVANLKYIKSIANTLEMFLLATSRTESEVKASSFVAATCRHLLSLYIDELTRDQEEARESFDVIPSRVLSSMLFFISGYTADAFEVAKKINLDEVYINYKFVYVNLLNLLTGKKCCTVNAEFADEELWNDPNLILLMRINQLVCKLSSYSFGELGYTRDEFVQEANIVQRDCSVRWNSRLKINQNDLEPFYFSSSFALPLHLVKLLKLIGLEVFSKSIISLSSPVDNAEEWKRNIHALYNERPYLWDNHLSAIATGYLSHGISSVVSLPTGSGKTTIANLKIASSLIGSGKVIYLVPTHALAHQVKTSLQIVFPNKEIRESFISDGSYSESEEVRLADVTVMTPERFLSLIGIHRQIYSQISLVVFDECHLLHSLTAERRSIDSMILLLKILENAPRVDLLLMSAMIANTTQIKDWLSNVWNKRTVSISIDWKPTRQLRGCLVFDSARIEEIDTTIRDLRTRNNLQQPNAATKRIAKATPFGLFCLRREWTRSRHDYALVKLINQDVQLALNRSFRLTPNKNFLSSNISEKIILQGRKVLIFAQNRKHCESIARNTSNFVNVQRVALNEYEAALLRSIIFEVGDEGKVIGLFNNKTACHHSLMITQERLLVESLFSRHDGMKLLVATPTLAQGLNLPAEVVIIAGDERFNAEEEGMESMEAFEILNAAGRAGRAGHSSNGMVLVIPSRIVTFSTEEQISGRRWRELQNIFSSGDQTVELTDPFEFILRNLALGMDVEEEKLNYLLSMLPSGYEDEESRLRNLLRKTFGYFRLWLRDEQYIAESGISRAIAGQDNLPSPEVDWKTEIVEATGLPLHLIESIIYYCTPIQNQIITGTVLNNIYVVFEWIRQFPNYIQYFFKSSNLDYFFDDTSEVISDLTLYREMLIVWLESGNIISVEDFIRENLNLRNPHDKARVFSLRVVPEISYLSGMFTLILKKLNEGNSEVNLSSLHFTNFSSCIREGFYTPEDLAGRYLLGPEYSRYEVRNFVDIVRDRIPPVSVFNDLGSLMGIIKRLSEQSF